MNSEKAIHDLIAKESIKKNDVKLDTKQDAIKEAKLRYTLTTKDAERKHWFDKYISLKGWDKKEGIDNKQLKRTDVAYLKKQRKYYLELLNKKDL